MFWEVSGGADSVVCGVVDGEGIAGEFIVSHDGFPCVVVLGVVECDCSVCAPLRVLLFSGLPRTR